MSQFAVMTMDEIKAIAEDHKCEVLVAGANELQFDLDTDAASDTFDAFYELRLKTRYASPMILDKATWKSKSGNNHVVVTIPEHLSVVERIAMQAMGGSDPGREFAALNCHNAGCEHPILLFKPLK